MKKLIILTLSILLFTIGVNAQIRSLELKNGSTLFGYISCQKSNGDFIFKTEYAIREVEGSEVNISNPHQCEVNDLDKNLVEYAKKHDAIEGSNDNAIIQLYRIQGSNIQTVNDAYIIEQGTTVRYFDPQSNSENYNWNDVKVIKEKKHPKTDISGIKTTCIINSATKYEGQYAGETDSTLSLYSDNGIVQTIKINDIKKYVFTGINPNQAIFGQSPYLDIIKTKSTGTLKGIITEKNFSTGKNSEDYFTLTSMPNNVQIIKVSDIEETGRELNPDYAPLTDIVLNPGEFMINRASVQSSQIESDGNELKIINPITLAVIDRNNKNYKKLALEYLGTGENSQFQLVKIQKKTAKKKNIYFFTYQTIVQSGTSSVSTAVSSNKTKKEEFTYPMPGDYILYNAKSNEGILFTIK